MASSDAQAGKRKRVSSESGRRRSGVFVEPGDLVRVQQVGGGWTVDHRKFHHVSARGYTWRADRRINQECKILDSRMYGTLVGKINGHVFKAGSGMVFRTTRRGRGSTGLAARSHDASRRDDLDGDGVERLR